MKKLIGLILITTATAGLAAPYIGTAAGYLIDSQESFISARVGFDVAKSATLAHQLEIEVGHTSEEEYSAKLSLTPVVANYRLQAAFNDKIDFSAGAGLGISRVKVSGFGWNDQGNAFTAQAFAGVGFKVTPKFSVTTNLRYLRIESVKLFGYKDKVGDDVAVEAASNSAFNHSRAARFHSRGVRQSNELATRANLYGGHVFSNCRVTRFKLIKYSGSLSSAP